MDAAQEDDQKNKKSDGFWRVTMAGFLVWSEHSHDDWNNRLLKVVLDLSLSS